MFVGGIDSYRIDLSSMVAFKGNHIWSAGKIFMARHVYLLITSSWPRHGVYHRGDRVRTRSGRLFASLTGRRSTGRRGGQRSHCNAPMSSFSRVSRAASSPPSYGVRVPSSVSGVPLRCSSEDSRSLYASRNRYPQLSTSAMHQTVPHIHCSLKIQMPQR